mmetsp:Transcript_18885/g.52685  ORF Transcript_18885/g.52685 Transcript_18885/m.52685 type:complete len:319 (+) Transcript_18885:280-1236(+)
MLEGVAEATGPTAGLASGSSARMPSGFGESALPPVAEKGDVVEGTGSGPAKSISTSIWGGRLSGDGPDCISSICSSMGCWSCGCVVDGGKDGGSCCCKMPGDRGDSDERAASAPAPSNARPARASFASARSLNGSFVLFGLLRSCGTESCRGVKSVGAQPPSRDTARAGSNTVLASIARISAGKTSKVCLGNFTRTRLSVLPTTVPLVPKGKSGFSWMYSTTSPRPYSETGLTRFHVMVLSPGLTHITSLTVEACISTAQPSPRATLSPKNKISCSAQCIPSYKVYPLAPMATTPGNMTSPSYRRQSPLKDSTKNWPC